MSASTRAGRAPMIANHVLPAFRGTWSRMAATVPLSALPSPTPHKHQMAKYAYPVLCHVCSAVPSAYASHVPLAITTTKPHA